MVSDRTLIVGALLALSVAFFARSGHARSSSPQPRRWTPEEADAMHRKLGAVGVSAIMLGNFAAAATPEKLAHSVLLSSGAQGAAQLAGQLVTHVFSFADRAGELYRASGNVWKRDHALERQLAAV